MPDDPTPTPVPDDPTPTPVPDDPTPTPVPVEQPTAEVEQYEDIPKTGDTSLALPLFSLFSSLAGLFHLKKKR